MQQFVRYCSLFSMFFLASFGIITSEAQTPYNGLLAVSAYKGGPSDLSSIYLTNGKTTNLHKLVNGDLLFWSDDSKQIIYRSQDEAVLRIGVDGKNARKLFDVPTKGRWDFSPDRKLVAILLKNEQKLSVIDLDTQKNTILVDKGVKENIFWSPDSKWIAYNKDQSLSVISSDGQKSVVISGAGELSPGLAGDTFTWWSPDSKWLTFRDSKTRALIIASLNGKEKHQLTDKEVYVTHWSPDSQWVIFGKGNGDTGAGLMNIVTYNTIQIDNVNIDNLVWLPDSLGFISDEGDKVVKVDTTGKSQVLATKTTSPVAGSSNINVSPDGKTFVYTQEVIKDSPRTMSGQTDTVDVFLANSGGSISPRHLLTINDAASFSTAWSPDSKQLALYNPFGFYVVNAVNGSTVKIWGKSGPLYAINVQWQPQ